jgi:hypothetical protein
MMTATSGPSAMALRLYGAAGAIAVTSGGDRRDLRGESATGSTRDASLKA